MPFPGPQPRRTCGTKPSTNKDYTDYTDCHPNTCRRPVLCELPKLHSSTALSCGEPTGHVLCMPHYSSCRHKVTYHGGIRQCTHAFARNIVRCIAPPNFTSFGGHWPHDVTHLSLNNPDTPCHGLKEVWYSAAKRLASSQSPWITAAARRWHFVIQPPRK